VAVEGEQVAAIDRGLVILLGVREGDRIEQAEKLAGKCAQLRVFDDESGRMGRSLLDLGDAGAALCVSQFTLYGDTRRGLRPSFTDAASADLAVALYERFCESLSRAGVSVERGRFGARMEVALVNEGPVTLMLDA
jgi:D-aminoacyl-tRNA deacylase